MTCKRSRTLGWVKIFSTTTISKIKNIIIFPILAIKDQISICLDYPKEFLTIKAFTLLEILENKFFLMNF